MSAERATASSRVQYLRGSVLVRFGNGKGERFMKQTESTHYIFFYREGSAAERDLPLIIKEQEACCRYICQVLRTEPDFKLRYYLCDSPEEVGRIYGDNEPCNGFAKMPDTVCAVYNEKIRCIGFHEDAHLISYRISRPDSPAVREGLAMYFDRSWWGIDNREWTGFYLKTGRYQPVWRMLDRDFFFSLDCSVSYPVMGAFTDWLISSYGMEKYLALYKARDTAAAFSDLYGMMPEELDTSFTEYIRLFRTDSAVEKRMEEMLTSR